MRGTYSMWHRLASEALVFVSERTDTSRDAEMLRSARLCGERALAMAPNPIAEALTAALLKAIDAMTVRLADEAKE